MLVLGLVQKKIFFVIIFVVAISFAAFLLLNNSRNDDVALSNSSSCSSSSQPSITVVSPNGGETYSIGQALTIQWTTCKTSSKDKILLDIEYNDGGYDTSRSVSFTPYNFPVPNTGSFETSVPDMNPEGQHWPFGGKHYTVRVCIVATSSLWSNGAVGGLSCSKVSDTSDDFFTLK